MRENPFNCLSLASILIIVLKHLQIYIILWRNKTSEWERDNIIKVIFKKCYFLWLLFHRPEYPQKDHFIMLNFFFTISLGGQVTHCFILHILFIYEYSRCCELSWGCMTQIPYLLWFCCSSVSSACAYILLLVFCLLAFFWGNSDHKIPIPECLAFQVLSFFKGLLLFFLTTKYLFA